MASKEVFNLLNLYQDDDDDDMEDAEKTENEDEITESEPQRRVEELRGAKKDESDEVGVPTTTANSTRLNPNSTPKWSNLRPPTPQQAQSFVPLDLDALRQRRDKPGIVDYGHDDVAMSPEAEEGEILGMRAGRVMYGEELENTRDIPQRTPTTNVQTMTPNNQVDSPQLSTQLDASQIDHSAEKELEAEVGIGANLSGEDRIDSDPVQNFLPSPPEEKCSDELQEKINKFLAYKRQGKSFNVEVRNRKDYRNPDFLRHAVRYQDIDEIGSCFSKDVFDPHGYDESDYFDAIEVDMKREAERKEQERKKSPKVDFVSGGSQAGITATAQKATLPSPGVSNLPSAGSQAGSAEISTREGRQTKKSKWDKVDGDRRNVFGGGHDTLSAVGSHAALLSAANAGAGYAVFAQQKRREAEEKRSSDRKAERRT
ncbi:uncharacterized protein LOC104900498 isoform X2 [Beta vulgaris subsp. vulgaris]|uniref:uncharacterized protein LOC104900498 isoform X2 n=1 Tax=Beta vulgaris subsp. vulgaris TaxID=3555 RepID=UPI002036DC70|nr:uncharacterized protein LOC104900498 isoform X2 [Beta vulgaris subsp. vulgaris]